MAQATKLTDSKLQALKAPDAGQIEISDADVPGLRVRIGKSGVKTFILRKRAAGKVKNITLGRYGPRFTLAQARRKARAIVSDLEAGKAPPAPQKRSQSTEGTVRALVPKYLATKTGLRSHAEIERVLNNHVLPMLGDRFADSITRTEITEFIDEIADRAPVMARAVHAQLSAFYTWALPRLERLPSNPCRDAGRPDKPKARDRILSYEEIKALWQVASDEAPPWGPGLKLLMLTAARKSEVFEADHAEFDPKAKIWTIPADRAKSGMPHIIPLSPAALEVVKSIDVSADSEKLFPALGNSERGPGGFSKVQKRFRAGIDKLLGRDDGDYWTLHDIRRTVATGLQRLGIRFEVTEAILNHVSGSKGGVAGIYQRYDWQAEKRTALEAWATELDRIVTGKKAINVVKLEIAS